MTPPRDQSYLPSASIYMGERKKERQWVATPTLKQWADKTISSIHHTPAEGLEKKGSGLGGVGGQFSSSAVTAEEFVHMYPCVRMHGKSETSLSSSSWTFFYKGRRFWMLPLPSHPPHLNFSARAVLLFPPQIRDFPRMSGNERAAGIQSGSLATLDLQIMTPCKHENVRAKD